jgi:hypothetical protein
LLLIGGLERSTFYTPPDLRSGTTELIFLELLFLLELPTK